VPRSLIFSGNPPSRQRPGISSVRCRVASAIS
jgi:hypothetical protein